MIEYSSSKEILFIYFIYLFADNNNHAVAHNNS